MYYFTREQYIDPKMHLNEEMLKVLQRQEQGFSEETIEIDNYNVKGVVHIDGLKKINLEYGEIISISSKGLPLKCLNYFC